MDIFVKIVHLEEKEMEVTLIDNTRPEFYEPLIILAHGTRCDERQTEWKSEQKTIDDMCKDLISWGHTGVFEHIKFSFHVSGISRCLTHQLVRHRIASYLQMSNRHAKPHACAYVTPPSVGEVSMKEYNDERLIAMYEDFIEKAYQNYEVLMEHGVPMEDARYLLPPGYFTHILVTMNGRELRHFFELRCAKDAQWEIRNMATQMLKLCYACFPVIFEDLYKKYGDDIE